MTNYIYFSVCQTSKSCPDLEMLILMINSDLVVTDLKTALGINNWERSLCLSNTNILSWKRTKEIELLACKALFCQKCADADSDVENLSKIFKEIICFKNIYKINCQSGHCGFGKEIIWSYEEGRVEPCYLVSFCIFLHFLEQGILYTEFSQHTTTWLLL